MASSETPKPKSTKSKKPKPQASGSGAAGGGAEKLKTVVRRLPPNLPEEVFWQSVQPWVTIETITWKQFYPGKIRKRYNKENIPSRAYIAFKNVELLATFSQAYDGHIFRDKQGIESQAVVEFAPYQKIPTEKKKVDSRIGTIEQDEDYISFLQSLSAPPSKPSDADTLEQLIAATHSAPEPKTTPLLEALLAEKSATKDKEAILRNHAHYQQGHGRGPIHAHAHPRGQGERDRDVADTRKGGKGAATGARHARTTEEAAGLDSGKKVRKSRKSDTTKEPSSAPTPALGRPKPSKPSRSTREPPAILQVDASAPAAASAVETPRSPTPSTPTPAKVERERRGRPAIGLGLASRQFEAALSGALPGGAARARREKEKEREKDKADKAEDSKDREADRGRETENGAAGAHEGQVVEQDSSATVERRARREGKERSPRAARRRDPIANADDDTSEKGAKGGPRKDAPLRSFARPGGGGSVAEGWSDASGSMLGDSGPGAPRGSRGGRGERGGRGGKRGGRGRGGGGGGPGGPVGGAGRGVPPPGVLPAMLGHD